MKPWQVVAIVLLVVVGIALVVYFATRRDAPATGDDVNGEGASESSADEVSAVGSAATGILATLVRATGN